nr:hypothetical protein [Euryarchaeota archaeon]
MDEQVLDSPIPESISLEDEKPNPIPIGNVESAPIFGGNVSPLAIVFEPKKEKINFLGFLVGLLTPPALFTVLCGILISGENTGFTTGIFFWIVLICSVVFIWPIGSGVGAVLAYRKGKNEEALGAFLSLLIWICVIVWFIIA